MQPHADLSCLPFDPAAMARVLEPIATARGLPNEAYVSPAFREWERDRVLARTWFCIGFGRDVANPGDAYPAQIQGIPLLMLRRYDGSIAVFHNVCSHRGAQIVTEPCSVKRRIRCPYHSWVYDLDGNLLATPHIGGPRINEAAGFDKAEHGLKPVRSAHFWDMVFVNLSGDAEPFEDFIAPLATRWADFDMNRIHHPGEVGSLKLTVNCNWKLAVENYCEAYHLPSIHPGLNSYSKLEDHYNIEVPGHFSGQGSHAYTPLLVKDGPGLPQFPDLPPKWDKAAEYASLYPNVLLGIHRDHYFAIRLEPIGNDRTVEHLEIYYVGEESAAPAFDATKAANLAAWRAVFAEDVEVVERMQRGRASPGYDGGVFSPAMDGPTHCFHRWLAERLAAA
ncbi:choline monooxygenase [Dongia mobilis]|uniref:Choline monooxygenase n=1 Tax=Dongia mobilis TaxID=578943 RepID=A0A4R6WQ89_9PROT|nr:aromatic ring-hydroxylating dioxygenase subunit alpha [Dongia mobilis]TDQ83295.1 choline monooxygenase [Dongia mobilis]